MHRRHPNLPWEKSDAIYHQIGVFIVEFSSIVAFMRNSIVRFLSEDEFHMINHKSGLVNVVFDKMTADPIRVAFFALCAEVADLNDEDRRIKDCLQAHIQRLTERRNEVAHADWSVGWVVHDTNEIIDPTATKIKVSKEGLGRETVYDPARLSDLIGETDHVVKVLRTFGFICRRRFAGESEVRPSDELEVVKTEKHGKIVRSRKVIPVQATEPD